MCINQKCCLFISLGFVSNSLTFAFLSDLFTLKSRAGQFCRHNGGNLCVLKHARPHLVLKMKSLQNTASFEAPKQLIQLTSTI